MNREKLMEAVAPDLEAIEKALRINLDAQVDVVKDVAGHILFSGGKRLRPLLMLLSARACGRSNPEDTLIATVFEYLHVASLLHDDIVDDAVMRRGKPVAHSIWGNPITVLVGDFLLAKSLTTVAGTGRADMVQVISEATEQMSQGEIHQIFRKGDIDLSEEEYMLVIRRKTATLISAACRVGAMLANAGPGPEKRLADYGLHLGIAFQMADDLIDYTSDTETMGKKAGADLREGKMTLPVIHALGQATNGDREWMISMIRKDAIDDTDVREFREKLDQYGSLSYTKKMAETHVARAVESLSVVPESKSLVLLKDIAAYVTARKK